MDVSGNIHLAALNLMEKVHDLNGHVEKLNPKENSCGLDVKPMWFKTVDSIDLGNSIEYTSNAILNLLLITFVLIFAQGLSRIKIYCIHFYQIYYNILLDVVILQKLNIFFKY